MKNLVKESKLTLVRTAPPPTRTEQLGGLSPLQLKEDFQSLVSFFLRSLTINQIKTYPGQFRSVPLRTRKQLVNLALKVRELPLCLRHDDLRYFSGLDLSVRDHIDQSFRENTEWATVNHYWNQYSFILHNFLTDAERKTYFFSLECSLLDSPTHKCLSGYLKTIKTHYPQISTLFNPQNNFHFWLIMIVMGNMLIALMSKPSCASP